MSGKKKAKYTKIELVPPGEGKRSLNLYAGEKVRIAVKELSRDMNLYHGVRFLEVMEAVYEQGLKDGRKEVIDRFEENITKKVNYLGPGRPRKSK